MFTKIVSAGLVIGMAWGAAAAAKQPSETASALPTPLDDADKCFSSCSECKGTKCALKSGKDREDCEERCYDANTACCEAKGFKGSLKACGCYK